MEKLETIGIMKMKQQETYYLSIMSTIETISMFTGYDVAILSSKKELPNGVNKDFGDTIKLRVYIDSDLNYDDYTLTTYKGCIPLSVVNEIIAEYVDEQLKIDKVEILSSLDISIDN